MININYCQQTPTLRLLLVLDKRMDYLRRNFRTSHQHKTIPNHTCIVGFKVFTVELWAVKEWNSLKQITIFLQSSQLEKYFKISENKTQLTFSFCGTLKSLNICSISGSSPRHYGFAFFLPTSKSLCGAPIGMNMRTYLHCIYCKVKTRIKGEK